MLLSSSGVLPGSKKRTEGSEEMTKHGHNLVHTARRAAFGAAALNLGLLLGLLLLTGIPVPEATFV